MLCFYEYRYNRNGADPSGWYQADTEDFKQFFRRVRDELSSVLIVVKDSDSWLWTNSKNRISGGWQKLSRSLISYDNVLRRER